MESDTASVRASEAGRQVMAAVEKGQEDRLVFADLGSEGAHLTVPLADAASLPAWR